MKTLLKVTLIILLVFSFGGANAEVTMRRYFELEGKIFQTGLDAKATEKYMDSARIIIQESEGGACETLFSAESGSYIFRLPLNNIYVITICKEGFLSKKLSVNTYVPLFTKGFYEMEFELGLFKSIEGLNVSALLDRPVADISYNSKKKNFDYDRNYTDQVNRGLKKVYTAHYLHRPIPVVVLKNPRDSKAANSKIGEKRKALRIFSGKIHK